MRRRLIAATLVALALALGGCTMQPDSRLDEYHADADRIMAETVALIPEQLVAEVGFSESEPRFGPTEGAAAPGDPAWWQALESLVLENRADASADAAASVSSALTSDGWERSRVRETEGGTRITDGFRREIDGGEWYIELTWVTTEPERAEVVEILVVSPMTVRGDSDAPS
jgi:hypothetical protein